MVEAKIPYILVVIFLIFIAFILNLCAISKVTLVVCIWLNSSLILTLMMISIRFKLH
jgi:hypothetical protein